MRQALRKKLVAFRRRRREIELFVNALKSPRHPILAHVVPIRRCNLACGYCNEYDRHSSPVPTKTLLDRIDHLAGLRTGMVHFSGGEPLLHPEIDRLIGRVRIRGMLAGILTNGYLLGPRVIGRLNRAGLDHLQISIDNVRPDEVSMKSLRVLEKKLRHLADHAEFSVNINSVLGPDLEHPGDALHIARRAREFGFTATVGILHDHTGRLRPLNEEQRRVYREIQRPRRSNFIAAAHNEFQENMVLGRPTIWQCHAGSRYLYICEEGLVHYCSQQRGRPAKPLLEYSTADLEREYGSEKSCAPFCTVGCVHRTAWLDELREDPARALRKFYPPQEAGDWSIADLPLPVRGLAWAFLPRNGRPRPLSRWAFKLLGTTGRFEI